MNRFKVKGGVSAPARARAAVGEALDGKLEPRLVHSARLLVTELVTNCVIHGGAAEDSVITVTTYLNRDAVRGEVCSEAPGFEPPREEPDITTPGGLGLHLVDRLAVSWGIKSNHHTCVWFRLEQDREGAAA